MTTQLTHYDRMRTELAQAHRLDEVKGIRDKAEALRQYARVAGEGLENQNMMAEIKLRAERRAGELLSDREPNRGARGSGSNQYQVRSHDVTTPTLSDLGISKMQSSRWQQEAAVPEAEFERHIAAVKSRGEELTSAGVRRIAKEIVREAKREANRDLVQQSTPLEDYAGQPCPTVVLDPPWDWGDEGDVDQLGRGRPTYDTMPLSDLMALPIPSLVTPDAHLYLWITNRSLPKGFQLLDAWGFRYVTMLTWCKPHFGMGNYFRGSTEHVLFGVRGSLPLLRRDVGTWFQAPRPGQHSSKPGELYELVESCSPGPWLELFARTQRPGWYYWGAEV